MLVPPHFQATTAFGIGMPAPVLTALVFLMKPQVPIFCKCVDPIAGRSSILSECEIKVGIFLLAGKCTNHYSNATKNFY